MREPDGYRIPLHTGLTQPILMGGVPKELAIMNFMIAAALTIGLKQPWFGIPFGIAGHVCLSFLSKKDPLFFDVIRRHFRQPKYFDA